MRDVKYKSVFKDYLTGELYLDKETWGTIKGGFKSPSQNNKGQKIGDVQFIGIQDKNNVDIYEGYIVNYAVKRKICPICSKKEIESELKYGISRFCPQCGEKLTDADFITTAEVIFDRAGFAYKHDNTDETYQSWPVHAAEIYIQWVKVIGNIYENPELLKKQKV